MEPVLPKLLALPILLLLVLAVTSAGARLVRLLIPSSSSEERRLFGFLLGFALLSIVTMASLFLRLPLRIVIPVLLAAGVLAGWRDAGELGSWAACWNWQGGTKERLVKLLIHAVFLLGIVGCLAPETGFDTGLYHFSLAQLRAREGWMVVRADIPAGYRPAYQEMLQTLGFVLQGETLASLINLAFYLCLLGLTSHWAGLVGGPRARLLGALGFLSLTVFILRAGGGDVEIGQAAYLSMALYALGRLRDGGSPAWRAVAGIGLGMALGIKYPSAWAIVALAPAWLVVWLSDRAPLTSLLADAGVIGALGLLIGSPWYLRNWLEVGNPVYPFFREGSGELAVTVGSLARAPLAFARLIAFDTFALAAVPALWSAKTRGARWVALAAGIFAGLIVLQKGFTPDGFGMMARYASPYFPGLVVLAGLGVDGALNRGPIPRYSAAGFLGLTLAVALAIHGARNVRKVPAALGLQPRDAYLEQRINSYWAIRRADRELAPGRSILLIEPRAYYCKGPYLVGSDSSLGVRFDRIGGAADFRELLRRHAIQFIVFSNPDFLQVWDFRNLLKRHPSILAEVGAETLEVRSDCTLYRVP